MLHEDRAASAGLDLRDYLMQADEMGAVSTEVLHDCIKAYLNEMDAPVAIKVCAVCGEQLIGDSSFRAPQSLSELGLLMLKAEDEAAFLRLPPDLQLRRCVHIHATAGRTKYYHLHPKGVHADGASVT